LDGAADVALVPLFLPTAADKTAEIKKKKNIPEYFID
jgi:hypothetical protein